jgi:thiol-disulfide isomerase/thioredoxin/DNA-binding CsgD family transcriptional regulator
MLSSWRARCCIAATLGSLVVCNLGCRERPAPAQPEPASVVASGGGANLVPQNGLSWYEDAPEAALAAARSAGKLVFVDLWAPWCHTCRSMQSFVLTAEKVPTLSRFVLLAVNTEREENAAFLERLPVTVWPTFYILNPDNVHNPEKFGVLGRWLGAASPAQFARFLAEGERARGLLQQGTGSPNDPLGILVGADDLATRGQFKAAAAAYGRALELAPADWQRRPETLVARMTALSKASDVAACLELADTSLAQTGSSASAVDFTSYALSCAAQTDKHDPKVERVRRAAEQLLRVLCETGSADLTPDDRADACDKLAAARTELADLPGARAALEQRLAVLEHAIVGLPNDLAVTYDWAFTDALIALGRAEDALSRARARELALPEDYNPPQHQARACKELKRWNEGLTAIERALTLAYGPRKVGFLGLKADLLLGAGRKDEAFAVVESQLAAYRALPAGQRQPAAEARVAQRLSTWK